MKQPLVSIVSPSFNQARYLEAALRSVLRQDYPRLEYIVVDGASTDGSVDIIRKYAEISESDGLPSNSWKHIVSWWVSEKDSGQAEAINKGMTRAQGDIVAWLNSDDYYLPGAVSAAVRTFEQNPDAVLVYADMLAVDEGGQTINQLKYRPLTLEDLLCFQIIGQPAVFMRRAAFEKAGGLDTSFHFLLDHHLWIRIAAQGRMVHVNQTWAAARYHAEAKNRAKASEFGREAFRILDWAKTQPHLVSFIGPRARASAHRVDARYLLDGGQPAASLAAWARALLIHPPTALARLNLLGSALLNLAGMDRLRQAFLEQRRKNYTGRG